MPEFELLRPTDLSRQEWRQLQTVSRESYSKQLKRPPAEIDFFTAWADPGHYYDSHVYPNSSAGLNLNAGQAFSSPRVVIAQEGRDLIGFAYAVNGTFGATKAERIIKMIGSPKQLWFHEIVVKPDYQRMGIASRLAAMLLFTGQPWQPVSTDIWPDETRFMPNVLRKLTFEPTGEQKEVPAFGEAATPVRQVRMQANSVVGVLRRLVGAE